MAAPVVSQRALIDYSGVTGGTLVRSPTWSRTATLVNHVLGRGAQLVASCAPMVTLTSSKTYDFSFYVQPRIQSLERVWVVSAYSTTPSTLTVTVPASGGTSYSWPVTADQQAPPRMFRQTLGSQSAAIGAVAIRVATGGSNAVIQSIGCWEVPRAELAIDTTDYGTDVALLRPGQPIISSAVSSAVTVLADTTKIGRRSSLLHWAVPYQNGVGNPVTSWASAVTSTTFTNFLSLPCPVLDRKLGRNDTTEAVTGFVQYWMSDGTTTGELRYNSVINGVSSAATLANQTTPTWLATSPASIDVDCEDMASADGRQTAASPAWDTITPQIRRASGSGTIYVAAYAVIGN